MNIKCKTGKACGKRCISRAYKCKGQSLLSPSENNSAALLAVAAGSAAAIAIANNYSFQATLPKRELSLRENVDNLEADAEKLKQGNLGSVAIVKDKATGIKYVIKQSFNDLSSRYALLQTSSEVTASDIAAAANIGMSRATMIPHDVDTPLKTRQRVGATLHTFAPGKPIKDLQDAGFQKFQDFNLKQERGMTDQILQSMSLNKELSKIAAFDTFIGNWDRKGENLFYDEKNNRYTGIDNGLSFTRNLGKDNNRYFEKLDFSKLSRKQISSIQTYTNTLEKLIKDNPPKKTIERYASYASQESSEKWELYKQLFPYQNINSNYKSNVKLAQTLKQKLKEFKLDNSDFYPKYFDAYLQAARI